MFVLKVEVSDWDTGDMIKLTLPCDLRTELDTSHEMQIIDWDGFMDIGFYNDVEKLNESIDRVNSECPSLTFKMFESIINAYGGGIDNEIIDKICEEDFMLEEVKGIAGGTDEEICARYLATKMYIPFAKNITESVLDDITKNYIDVIEWDKVWKYYEQMGFSIIICDQKTYVLHLGRSTDIY